MNCFFLDASALAKRYSLEVGADLVDHLFNNVAVDRLMCFMLGAAEVASVLVRRRNGGLLSPAAFAQGMNNLTLEIVEDDDFTTLEMTNELITNALPLLERYFVNSTDAVVLRAVVDVAAQLRLSGDDLVLIASDQRLLRAAQAEGLTTTFDPEVQVQADLDVLLVP